MAFLGCVYVAWEWGLLVFVSYHWRGYIIIHQIGSWRNVWHGLQEYFRGEIFVS